MKIVDAFGRAWMQEATRTLISRNSNADIVMVLPFCESARSLNVGKKWRNLTKQLQLADNSWVLASGLNSH